MSKGLTPFLDLGNSLKMKINFHIERYTVCAKDCGPYEVKNKHRQSEKSMTGNTIKRQ